MEMYQEPATWQEYLGQLIKDVRIRELMAEDARLRAITLQRWANGTSKPRDENMRTLLRVLPANHQVLFARLIADEYPNLLRETPLTEPRYQSLSAEFYSRVLNALAITPQPMGRQVIQDLLFGHALDQLDKEHHGLSLSLVCCVPPRPGEQIYSLREVGGTGTPPWSPDPDQRTMFLGSESLVGHTLVNFHFDVINSRQEVSLLPANWTEHEQSVATFPISRFARLAGCLLVSSAVEHFFTPDCVSLLEHYANLAALIFEPEEFYDPSLINLKMMPSEEVQASYFRDFNQRVTRKFTEVTALHNPVTLQEVHQLVWQDIQDELAQVFLQKTT